MPIYYTRALHLEVIEDLSEGRSFGKRFADSQAENPHNERWFPTMLQRT